MAVLNTKPHTLSYLVTEQGYTDGRGDWHEGASRWEGCIPCDAVPAGRAEERAFEDGVTRRYSYTVYLPADCRTFAIGDTVRVTLSGGKVREFEVKGFHRYQQQCKLWV